MKDKQCVICGKTYTPTGTKQSYCSYDCYLVAQKRRRAKKPVELKCEWCGKTFTQRLGRIYCSLSAVRQRQRNTTDGTAGSITP